MVKPELVAAAFRSRNAEKLRREELVQELAFSLHLMSPTAAADAIEAALASGLLEPAGEQLRLVGEGDALAEELAPAVAPPCSLSVRRRVLGSLSTTHRALIYGTPSIRRS